MYEKNKDQLGSNFNKAEENDWASIVAVNRLRYIRFGLHFEGKSNAICQNTRCGKQDKEEGQG